MSRPFDHFIFAGADLDSMCAGFAERTGVAPTRGGRHPGRGTRNALLSLGQGLYLELLAVDPAQRLEGTMGATLAALPAARLFGYMMKADDLERVHATLARHGVAADLFEATRQTNAGKTLHWRLVVPHSNRFGTLVPNFIDWGDTEHPSTGSARGCGFASFSLAHPEAGELAVLLADLDCDIAVRQSAAPMQRLVVATPRGPQGLSDAGWDA